MEHTLKLAKVEATKQLLMPRVSLLKRTNSGYAERRSSIPGKDNHPSDFANKNEEEDSRIRAYTIHQDVRHSRPEVSELQSEVEVKGEKEEISEEKEKMDKLEQEEKMRQEFGLHEEKPTGRESAINFRNSIRESVGFVNSKILKLKIH